MNRTEEITSLTIKFWIGAIAVGLPIASLILPPLPLTTISESYRISGITGDVFVGALFAIGSLISAYNGQSLADKVFARIAAIAAFGVALFPCECAERAWAQPATLNECGVIQPSPIHAFSAGAMFLILAYFCWRFFERARGKVHVDASHIQAKIRAGIYLACLACILAVIAMSLLNHWLHWTKERPYLVFFYEWAGLWAFGLSWMTASRVVPLPFLTRADERHHLL